MSEYIPLSEAAEILGLSTEAIRKRIKRKTMDGYMDESGRWMVRLESRHISPDIDGNRELEPYQQPLIETVIIEELRGLRAEVQQLRIELEARDNKQPSRDQWIVERMREAMDERQKEHKPWWKLW